MKKWQENRLRRIFNGVLRIRREYTPERTKRIKSWIDSQHYEYRDVDIGEGVKYTIEFISGQILEIELADEFDQLPDDWDYLSELRIYLNNLYERLK